jgi:hypothetical protein
MACASAKFIPLRARPSMHSTASSRPSPVTSLACMSMIWRRSAGPHSHAHQRPPVEWREKHTVATLSSKKGTSAKLGISAESIAAGSFCNVCHHAIKGLLP